MNIGKSADNAPAVILLVLLVATITPAVLSLRSVTWPYDLDGFRDVAIAQAIRDGAWRNDPFYRGEAACTTHSFPRRFP